MTAGNGQSGNGGRVDAPPPLAMLAEITHRCPLACPYCSNPLELKSASEELTTEEWIDVFEQAAKLGVLHLHLSGGEPLARRDLLELTRGAVRADLYTNLITSGIGLTESRLDGLAEVGLDHVQLSLQGVDETTSDFISGYHGGHTRKIQVASWVRARGIPLTVNAVCHRMNMAVIPEMIELAVKLGARRLEIATVQFHGWAIVNRNQLMPTRAQVEETTQLVEKARKEREGELVIDYVPADYYATYPKACMGGWGRTGINIDPTGRALPCHAAETIPSLTFDNVRDKSLSDIWYHSSSFNAFRGTDWMAEPCRTCDRREMDFGGCRCQAMAIAGHANAADPACYKSPFKEEMLALAETASQSGTVEPFVYRGR
ncbi:MAG: pyrroloquinoline quinone biosynthesis protein PqqE [Pseudomonadota bacterium]